MMLLVLAVLSIVGVFMLSATVNFSNQFRSQVGAVFTTNLLSEMNSAADSPQETAVAQISNTLDAYRGTLGIGAGREYSTGRAAYGRRPPRRRLTARWRCPPTWPPR